MSPTLHSERRLRLRLPAIPVQAGILLLASMLVLGHYGEHYRSRTVFHSGVGAVWTLAPPVSMVFAACPQVSSPVAVVARFSIWLLPMVASIVTVCRMREVYTAQLGGLHGP